MLLFRFEFLIDDGAQITHILGFDDFAQFKLDAEMFFQFTDYLHIRQRIPSIHIVSRRFISDDEIRHAEHIFDDCFDYLKHFLIIHDY